LMARPGIFAAPAAIDGMSRPLANIRRAALAAYRHCQREIVM
jgi:hypothetical protein